jgi:hypothetical protein
MNTRELELFQDLEKRIAALEAERAGFDEVIKHCAAAIEAIAECREDFRGFPRYSLRYPQIGRLPGGLARALAHRGHLHRLQDPEGRIAE